MTTASRHARLAADSRHILGMRVDATSYADAAGKIARWAQADDSRYVCVATVNNVMEAYDSTDFRNIMNAADLVTPGSVISLPIIVSNQ